MHARLQFVRDLFLEEILQITVVCQEGLAMTVANILENNCNNTMFTSLNRHTACQTIVSFPSSSKFIMKVAGVVVFVVIYCLFE